MNENTIDSQQSQSDMQALRSLGRDKHSLSGSRSGGVLVLALIAVVVAASLSVAFLQLSTSVTRRQVQSQDDKASFYMAEAGLAEAFCGMMQGKTGEVGSEESPAAYGDGLFWVEVVDLGDNLVRLDSTGMIGSGSAVLSLVAERGTTNVASLGVYSEQAMAIPPGSQLDAFDSRLGSYATQEANLLAIVDDLLGGLLLGGGSAQEAETPDVPDARVGSSAGVSITGTDALPTVIRGNVVAGPNETVEQNGDVSISGSIETASGTTTLPVVVVPTLAQSRSILHEARTPLLIQSGSAHVPTLQAANGTQIVLEGPSTVVIDRLLLGTSSSLTLDTTEGPVELYVTQELTAGSDSSIITSTQDPTAFSLQIAGTPATPVQLPSGGPIFGFIYAPEAKLILPSGMELHGGIIGDELEFLGPVSLHFDQYLADMSELSSLPSYINWRLVEISQDLKGGVLGLSPFERLGVAQGALRSPSQSHADQWIDIEYLDGASALQSFSGMESAFDWNQVKETKELERDGAQVPKNSRDDLLLKSALDDPVRLLEVNGVTASAEKRAALIASSPLSRVSLSRMMESDNPMDSPDVLAVLNANAPLEQEVIYTATTSGALNSTDLLTLLLGNSPGLGGPILTALSGRGTPLSIGQIATVLLAQ